MERTYEIIAVHPGTGEVTRFMIAASSAYEARERAEACGLSHVVVHGPGGGEASERATPGLAG